MLAKNNLETKFNLIVKKNKFKNALIFPNRRKITFDLLDRNSNIIAKKFLVQKNLNSRICIYSDKNEFVFYLILACLKVGKSYTVLDVDAPINRNKKIVTTLNPGLLFNLTDKKFFIKRKKIINKKSVVKTLKFETLKYENKLLNKTKKESVAYVMFTSGSTGAPKGAKISHENILNFIEWSKKQYDFHKEEVFANLNGLHFDNSVFDIYASLFNGYTLVPFNKNELLDPNLFIKISKIFKITNWFSVPSLILYFLKFNCISDKKLPFIKRMIFGGEAFPKKELKTLFKKTKNKIKLYNVYGPTECTCICSSYLIKNKDFKKNEMKRYAPLGKKMINKFKYEIIKSDGKKAVNGKKGELILKGVNVGLGYLNNKFETKKRFYLAPVKRNLKLRHYRTGDIVYKDKKSKLIYFVSRADNQIKFMGHRIELDEIEIALNKIKNIKRCVVTFGKKNNTYEITAWVILKNQKNCDFTKEVAKDLPNYMIPRKFNFIKDLPINPNGKIDKIKLKEGYYD